MIERLVYRSDAVASPDGEVDLEAIVETSVINNARRGITGALAHQSGVFAQVLEGDPEALSETLLAIEADPRHRNVRVLARWPVQTQVFAGRPMVLVETRKLSPHLSKLVSETGSGVHVTGVLADLVNARPGPVA